MQSQIVPTVLISGAGGLLGTALAQLFMDKGYCVYALTSEPSKEVGANEITPPRQGIFQIHCNIIDESSVDSALDSLTALRIDKVVLCHGGMCGASSDPMNAYTSIQEVMNLNLFSNVKIIEKLKVNLINGKSTICMISSISGLETHGIPSYSAAKSALIAYTRSVGRYLSSYGVSMFAVSPGAFEGTDQGYWRQLQLENPEAYSNFVKSRMAIGRIGTVEEVSNFIFQMCRCATPYVAGNNFVLDGGQGRGFYG